MSLSQPACAMCLFRLRQIETPGLDLRSGNLFDSPFTPWNSAAEYQDEIGQSRGGKNNRKLRERFRRISGLVISIERKTQTAQADQFFTVVEKSYFQRPSRMILMRSHSSRACLNLPIAMPLS